MTTQTTQTTDVIVARKEPSHPAAPAPLTAAAPTRKRRGSTMKRFALALLAAGILAALGLALVPRPVPVESAVASRGPLRVTVDEDGVARIQDRYVVSAPLSGRLARIEKNPGDPVQAGELLARLLPSAAPLLDERTRREAEARLAMSLAAREQAGAQVERAAARWEYARADATRKRELEAKGALPHELVEQADLALRSATSELDSLHFGEQVAGHEAEMARAALGQFTGPRNREQVAINSPVRGKILRVIQESEGVVAAGAPLLELGDPNALEIAIDVLTSDAVRIKPAAVVRFERWGGQTLEGRVRRVDPSAFTRVSALGVEEQRVNVIVDLTSPREAWAALGDGYRVEARIIVWEAADVLQVPSSAVFRHEDGWAVFGIRDGVARLMPVQLGERTPRAVQVQTGIQAGDQVILHPSDRVRGGTKVTPRD